MKQLSVFVPTLARPVVFLLLGPSLGLFGSVLAERMIKGSWVCLSCNLEPPVLAILFYFCVSLVSFPVDAALSRFTPALVRVPLTALCGAVIAASLLMWLGGGKYISPAQMHPVPMIAAITMGMCALLSNGRNSAPAQ